jgi:hypothetical protein
VHSSLLVSAWSHLPRLSVNDPDNYSSHQRFSLYKNCMQLFAWTKFIKLDAPCSILLPIKTKAVYPEKSF